MYASGFRFYFTPLPGFFSPFPHGTGSLSVDYEYLALEDGPPIFRQDFSCPALLVVSLVPQWRFRIRDYHALWSYFPECSSISTAITNRLFRVRSPLLTESLFIFSSYGYLDVSVPHVRLPYGMTGLQPAGLPHSDIPGSTAICASPGLFAAYHVLRRLREPRHPPSALAYFLSPRTYARVDIS